MQLCEKPARIDLLSAAILLLLSTWPGGASSAPVGRQSCSGVLMHDDGGYLLLPDPDSTPWCPAYIGDDDKSPQARKVLKTCKVGGRCHIEGTFSGHGNFYWTQLSSVKSLDK